MGDPIVTPLPDWWEPGLPLPPLYPMVVHTGRGRINRMKTKGGATTTTYAVRWETLAERNARKAKP